MTVSMTKIASACRWIWCSSYVALLGVSLAGAQELTVTARVALAGGDEAARERAADNVVVWLTPAAGIAKPVTFRQAQPPRLVQRNKSFDPHVLVVRVGAVVAFPNHDPFFHNVFSLFEGRRFDLGLYEAGSTREVHFNKPGISYIFCNIHPEMSAVVLALDTPYYAVSDPHGQILIANVPAGKYTVRVWYELALPEALKALTREVTVSENSSTLGVLRLAPGNLPTGHKNLYGRDYDPPTPDSPAYDPH